MWRAGINPFRFTPLDPHLAALRALHPDIFRGINYPELPTIYPLTSQLTFLLASFVAPGVTGLKIALCAAEIVGLGVLRRALRRAGRPASWAILAAWHPLALSETAANGHVDAVGGLFLLLAACGAARWPPVSPGTLADESARQSSKRSGWLHPIGMAAALTAAALTKWSVLVVLPALRLTWRTWIALVLLTVAGAAVFIAPGVNPFFSLGQYVERWRWNDSLFWLLMRAAGDLRIAKVIAALALLAWVLGVSRRERRPDWAARSAFGALLLLAPTLHPWYLLWILPLVACSPEPGWLWLLATLPLSYGPFPHRLAEKQEDLTLGLRLVEFGPAFGWWGWVWARRALSAWSRAGKPLRGPGPRPTPPSI
ncbi:MAG: hypothetical protein HZB25_05410 [Candidatus Eisenbacteria bacterium]|nr:hypothetical protein [Candidatus Eisenbacteria bacterium]